jgi:hypothetical protein
MPASRHRTPAPGVAFVATLAAGLMLAACGDGGQPERRTATTRPAQPAQPARTPHEDAAGPTPRPSTRAALMRSLRGRRLPVDGHRVALDPATLTCVGVGPAQSTGRTPTWTSWRCVQPTFPPGETVGSDLVFVAELVDGRLVTRGARMTRY